MELFSHTGADQLNPGSWGSSEMEKQERDREVFIALG